MESISFNEALLSVIYLLGEEVKSRKKLHKIVYLLRQRDRDLVDVEYTFGLYGPYSPELDYHLWELVDNGKVEIEETDGGWMIIKAISNVNLSSKMMKYKEYIEKLNTFEPWELEIITTVYYFNPEATDEEATEIVRLLKPGKFAEGEVRRVWKKYKNIFEDIN